MVRLKLKDFDGGFYYFRDFNPTMVRLKLLVRIWQISLALRLFQSHNGSIKTLRLHNDFLMFHSISIPQWFD